MVKAMKRDVDAVAAFWEATDRYEREILRYMIIELRYLRDDLQRVTDRYTRIQKSILPFDEVNILRRRIEKYDVEISDTSYLALLMYHIKTHRRVHTSKAMQCECLMQYTAYQSNVYKKYRTALKKAVKAADPGGKAFDFEKNKVIPLYGTSLDDMLQTNAEYYTKRLCEAVERVRRIGQTPDLRAPQCKHILDMARKDMLAESPKTGNLYGILDRAYLFELGNRRIEELKRLGFEKVRFIAVLDNATTDECRGLNGKVFRVDDLVIGKNAPPIYPPPHPCRSRLIGIQ